MKRINEQAALQHLNRVIEMDKVDRDALPGSVVKLVKQAAIILKKRQK